MAQKYKVQLYEGFGGFPTGKIINATGGKCLVVTAGGTSKQAITDSAGASATNSIAMTNGGCTFYTADTVTTVDLYIQTPGGQFTVELTAAAGQIDIGVDVKQRDQVMVIPFSMTDLTANTETATGFTEPANSIFRPTVSIRTTTLDAGEDIDVGTLSTDSGDADGFISGLSINAAVNLVGTLANGAVTLGALLSTDEDGSGALVPECHVGAAKSITLTISDGSDTGEGLAYLPYYLVN